MDAGLAPFRFDRTWTFPVPPERFWELICRTGDYARWWPWLRTIEGGSLALGETVTCAVRSPLPYTIGVTVHIRELEEGKLVVGEVGGDLAGPARLEVAPDPARPDRCRVRLAWTVELRRPMLRAVAKVGRPAMEWGHDWVVAQGVDQFRRSALGVGDGA